MILRDAIDHYVAWRRAHGARFITSARALCQFCKSVPEQVCCDAVTEMEVRRFLGLCAQHVETTSQRRPRPVKH